MGLIAQKTRTYLCEGNLDAARQILHSAARDLEPISFVVDLAARQGLGWLLDDEQTDLLLRLPIGAWNNDRVDRGLSFAMIYHLRHDPEHQLQYAEEARQALEERLTGLPEDADSHANLGLALAYLGRKEPAIREGQYAIALMPVTKNAIEGPVYPFALALIYATVGEADRAVAELDALLKIPFFVSSGWLTVDPNFDSLRNNSRFRKLIGGGA